MLVPFESLPDHSRLWIYQSSRKFSPLEKEKISNHLIDFVSEWAAHGQPLKSSFQILFDHFIILAADEQHHAASGCSIDDSVRSIKMLEQLGIELFNRDWVAFKKGNEIELIAIHELKEKNKLGIWSKDSLAFNNLISKKGELEKNWIVPAGNTWLKRYLPSEMVSS
jgi:hypothetical protein